MGLRDVFELSCGSCLPVVPPPHLILSHRPPSLRLLPLFSCPFSFHLPGFYLPKKKTLRSKKNLLSLCVCQDKLSEEKQREENGSPPAAQTEPDPGTPPPPPHAEPDASQADEDKDTELLLDRLKALEVTTPPGGLSSLLSTFLHSSSSHRWRSPVGQL